MTTPRGIPQIRFAALAFDPLTERVVSPDTGGSQALAGAAERVVVQFHAPLTRRDQERLKSEYGLALRDYVPDYAYLEQLTTATLEKLRQDPLTRATVAYQAAFKIVPGIGEREFRTEERRAVKGLWITCVLFRDADPEPVAKAIEAIGGPRGRGRGRSARRRRAKDQRHRRFHRLPSRRSPRYATSS